MRHIPAFLADRLAGSLAMGICVSVACLSWFGYHAIVEWRNTSVVLANRRASEAADLLLTALTRDMRGVHASVLSSPEWSHFASDRPQDITNMIASAFARYPYPASFFAWKDGSDLDAIVFFTRSDRRPSWAPTQVERSRFPVAIARDAVIARKLMDRILADAARSRQLSAFEIVLGAVTYQIVAQLTYSDVYRERLSRVVGFTVDLPWAKANYFAELANEVWQIAPGTERGLTLSVTDGTARVVAGTAIPDASELTHRRQFPLMFFEADAEADRSHARGREVWTVAVSASGDPSLSRAIGVANRMLLVGAASALALAVGLILMVRAERTGAKLAQMRSDFVSTVTHELKTPIATIQAAADTLSRDRLSGMSFQTCGRIVSMETRRLSHLVENLLAYSRITDVADTYTFEPVEIGVLFNDVQQAFEAVLDQRGFELEMSIAPGAPCIRGDRLALRLLFDNLVDNAVKYSGKERTLLLNATSMGTRVSIEVIDSGLGIPQDEIPLVTRKFVRGRGASSGGSGLGLTIARRIAEDHGGTLQIRSALGAGTTVTVNLPAT